MSGPIKDFRALKPLRKALMVQREARLVAAAERLRLTQQAERDSEKFSQKIGPVFPLKLSDTLPPHQFHPKPLPRTIQKMLALDVSADHATILQASLSDQFSIENLLDSEEYLRFARNGVGADVLTKLHRGHWAIRQQVDLHGLRVDQARDTLAEFLQVAQRRGWRCVSIIHGKGFGSVNQVPVLKGKVRDWLVQIEGVVAFCQASEAEGGSGALVVLLKSRTRPDN
ncbi:Smr/MutS family protein [Glaciimonas immobilis]|uniref:DNA-nicking Smr family endonuclease n=1 Tax=Glaciimonas immobilis TaxID=728004 RepID=A0A840RNP2_9BURK|nr:Smr/MutS family protein [Glaciimonas immobilis]KAF3999160.1 DNA mismatch repair protein MutS [Glaciimonas immobilis]MBB5198606.1 DNA-nicking Smr family endonuclease [Glaciimonas immobilis]